ncbi:sorting nexin-19 isoform X1 [Xiphophorus couchianus]|uniref:sorting nexin-19 isoform X1 n=1 Tax=Xiphophorus couchianus TaxID=32473 RepID=UPI001015F4E5|nr:sorting nexin-19 isoform X1 [Xiphophorus couchianus]
MAEVMGQRSLMGFGVLLAWLLLFHLLVNIWLLCVFTSLLLVLGGWFGSQAILESNSLVHLERFINLEQVQSSAEDKEHLDQEIHNTVRKIIRDFVISWYSTVSTESSFELKVHEAMISMAMKLKLRAKHIDRKELTQKVLNLVGGHLQDYLTAKELAKEKYRSESEQLWKAYSSVATPHVAMSDDSAEVNYVRAIVALLLHILVPSPHLETNTGRFVVGELITSNVFLPLVAKLSDPDWLNLLIIEILCKSSTPLDTVASKLETCSLPLPAAESEAPTLQCVTQANSESLQQGAETELTDDTEAALPELHAYDATDTEEVKFPQTFSGEEEASRPFLRCYLRGRKSNPFYQETDSDPDSPLADYKPTSTDSLLMMGQEDTLYDRSRNYITTAEDNNSIDLEEVSPSPVDSSYPKVLLNSVLVDSPNDGCLSSLRDTEVTCSTDSLRDLKRENSSPGVSRSRELVLGVEPTGLGNPSELIMASPLQGCSPVSTFSFEPLSSPEGPVIIQNLRITGTITAKEHRGTGSHPYTLYTIKYETLVGCENLESIQAGSELMESIQIGSENPTPIQPVAYHMVNRRYSEFLNLQTRLEEKSELRKLIKGVKGPKKVFPEMPFGNMDSDKIEARKGLLETFLKQLCSISEIANSEEMQEFLALNTDARIAFVKKPFIVSRIDKIVVNAIVGTLKTAFPHSEPQSPTEDTESEVDGGKMGTDKKNRSRLKLSSKGVLFMNGSEIRPPVSFVWDQTSTVFNGMTLVDLQAFITEEEKSLQKETEMEGGPVLGQWVGCRGHGVRAEQCEEHDSAGGMSQAKVALNILCLLMKEQWSWLCSKNIQKTVRLLFGTLINRWLDVSVANLTCTKYWVVYLQVIQEAVWPGGTLPAAPPPHRSQQQKDSSKQQALDGLMKLLPDVVSDMLGSDKYRLSWQTALDSFQDPYINRHLVYCIFDLLLDFLVPELPEDDFQRSLLQTLSKKPEKMLA